jgi:putative toxin-antitoxin system antitoxin component (TIGR02293 family)
MAHATAAIDRILTVFGLESTSNKGRPLELLKPLAVHERILSGFPSEVLDLAGKAFGLALNDLAKIIGVSTKTIQRKLSARKPLSNAESDRFYRGMHIFIFAAEVFRDAGVAKQWMTEHQPALGGFIPMDLLETEAGAEEVYHLLGRIRHGVIS